MNSRWKNAGKLVSVTLVLGLILVLFAGVDQDVDGAWESTVFEEEIEISRFPDHIDDRPPLNMEPLHIIIRSKDGQFINHADVSLTFSMEGTTSSPGGYPFERLNQTTLEVEIPGHRGGTTIQYHIIAYDEANHPLTSTTYSYTVQMNGSWQGDEFDENIDIQWGPKNPSEGEKVRINITTLDNNVTFSRADLLYTVSIPDQDPQDGVTYFEEVDRNRMTGTIIAYPPGSSVSFRIVAYDSYLNKITSQDIYYSYQAPPPAEPIYTGYLFIQLKDVADPASTQEGTITFSNETYSYTAETTNKMGMTNTSVYQGSYNVKIEYKDKTYDKVVSVPTPDGKFSFVMDVNQKTYDVGFDKEEKPSWVDAIGVVLLIILTGVMIIGSRKVKEIREGINEKKKKARKSKDTKETWIEKIMTDEGRKETTIRSGAILLLAVLGLIWAPFYPWWMVIILSLFIMGVSIKYPYISMLILALFVSASAAYQSREFGWVFLVFSLVVMIGGFFDWRYAYLTYLTVFAAGLGVGYAVPLVAALAISLFMGTVVLITAGVFLLVIAPSGNFNFYSLLATAPHDRSFVTFSRPADANWSPVDFVNAIGSLSEVDLDIISKVLSETASELMPLVGLLGWGLALVAIYLIFKRVEKGKVVEDPDPKGWGMRLIPAAILIAVTVVIYFWAGLDFTIWFPVALIGAIPAAILPFTVRKFGEETLPISYGMEEVKSSDVGQKISEMVGFRKATFKDIGGLENVKREVKNAITVPLLEPEMAEKYGVKPSKGMMLFGPPGCGKTLMLRAVASDLNVDMIGIKCSDVMSKWYGESENLIASLYEEAKQRSPCILFLDEIDSIAKRRDFYSTDDVTPRVLSIMLSEMDGMDEAEGVIVVATTNMPDLVDPALMRPGRFDKVIYVPPPDTKSREEILKIHLKGKFVSDDIDIEGISRKTKGFSGADIANLIREASSLGLEKALETGKPQPITNEDIYRILDEIKPSVTKKMIESYDKLRTDYERKRRGKKPEKSIRKTRKSEIPKPPKIPDKEEDENSEEVQWEG